VIATLGFYLNVKRPGRRLIDPDTQKEIVLRRRHTFFFIPMQFWSLVPLVMGLRLLFVGKP